MIKKNLNSKNVKRLNLNEQKNTLGGHFINDENHGVLWFCMDSLGNSWSSFADESNASGEISCTKRIVPIDELNPMPLNMFI